MRISTLIPAAVTFVFAGVLSVAAALYTVDVIEETAQRQIGQVLTIDGQDWADVAVDGLQVRISGRAPDEATRFRALSLAGNIVDPTRVIDAVRVAPGKKIEPPRFAIEILRNDSGISLIGLVPQAMDRARAAAEIRQLSEGADVIDLLESADYPMPPGWGAALEYALDALAQLPRSKISVTSDRVSITAISDSRAEKSRLETALARAAPDSLALELDISAPRPVITPFTLRFLIDERGARFDACTAHTPEGRDRILAAAATAGLEGRAQCPVGLGVPSPRWPDAVATGIAALAELGGGSLTFSDADVSLVALPSTPQDRFDRVVGQLEADLPDVFSLKAVLPEPVAEAGSGKDAGPPEFVATLSPEGLVQLRGRITDERLKSAVEGFARAQFAAAELNPAMRVDPELPEGWAARVFAGVESLGRLEHGAATVQPDFVEVRGVTGDRDARAEISRILSSKLGAAANFAIDVSYDARFDPTTGLPSPEECVSQINAILDKRQITFAPGSDTIDAEARDSIERIADVMKKCSEAKMEIGGHTDSQGREEMNQDLSQRRAEAVLDALRARRVLTGNLTARGYGEDQPIANNATEVGREANRRIEFTLIEPEQETAEAEDAAEQSGDADEQN